MGNAELSADEINDIFARNLVPGRLANTFLRAANIFTQGGSDKKSFRKVRFNTAKSMTSMDSAGEPRPSPEQHEDATCYYVVEHTYVHKGRASGKMHFTPWLGVSVGIANSNDVWGSEAMVNIMLDVREPESIEIEYALPGNLGIAVPQRHDQKIVIMRAVASWMDRIDNGETLDPIECRQQIKAATGLTDDLTPRICRKTMLDTMLARLSAPYMAKVAESHSIKAGTRLKQVYAMGRGRNRHAP